MRTDACRARVTPTLNDVLHVALGEALRLRQAVLDGRANEVTGAKTRMRPTPSSTDATDATRHQATLASVAQALTDNGAGSHR